MLTVVDGAEMVATTVWHRPAAIAATVQTMAHESPAQVLTDWFLMDQAFVVATPLMVVLPTVPCVQ